MTAPRRLLDDPSLMQELRTDLSRSVGARSDYDAAAGLVGFQAAIAASSVAAGAAAAEIANAPQAVSAAGTAGVKAAGSFGAAAAKVGLTLLSTAVIVAGAVSWRATRGRPADGSAPAADRQARSADQKPATAQVPVVETRAEEAAPEVDPALRREIDQLGRIKALIERDPAQAYELARRGDREFRSGMLRHEREGLAVLALWNMGRSREAEQRTRAFLARYPQSPLREALEQRRKPAGH